MLQRGQVVGGLLSSSSSSLVPASGPQWHRGDHAVLWKAGHAYGDVQCLFLPLPWGRLWPAVFSCMLAVIVCWNPCKYRIGFAFPASVGMPSCMFFHSVFLSLFLPHPACQHLHGFLETVLCFLSSACTVHPGIMIHIKDYLRLYAKKNKSHQFHIMCH